MTGIREKKRCKRRKTKESIRENWKKKEYNLKKITGEKINTTVFMKKTHKYCNGNRSNNRHNNTFFPLHPPNTTLL